MDQMLDHSVGSIEINKNLKPPIEVASKVIANPSHPDWIEDKAVAKTIAGGQSGLIAAIDGVSSGGRMSDEASGIIQKNLNALETKFMAPPTINQAAEILRSTITASSAEIGELQSREGNSDIDSTVSAGIVCKGRDNNRRFLVTANVGDSRIYRFRPSAGTVEPITTDHSLVQSLVAAGQLTPDQAFLHPDRNIVLRTVGDVERKGVEVDINVTEIQDGEIFLAVSDGVSDNLTPTGLAVAVLNEFQASFDQAAKKPDLQKFANAIAQRARTIQSSPTAPQAKPDDICVAILRAPRT